MSTNPAPITDRDLDRLADGELAASEQRELLAAIEATPGSWRRCALAFVEAQAMSRELAGYASEFASRPALIARPAAKSSKASLGNWLAIAATVLVAFTAGLLANRSVEPTATGTTIVGDSASMVVERGPTRGQLADAPVQRIDRPDPDGVTFWTRDDQGERRSLRAKLVDAEEMNQRLGVEFRSAVPPQIRRQLEQRGYRLESRQRYAPLNIDNDRVLVVPVEDMQVQPVPLNYL